jgi:hypothetical protein
MLDFNTTKDVATRWMLHVWQNRRLDGEVWLVVVREDRDLRLIRDDELEPPDQVYGELESEVVGDRFVYTIVPVRQRHPAEIERMRAKTEAHKAYRAECYRRYSFTKRIEHLRGAQ